MKNLILLLLLIVGVTNAQSQNDTVPHKSISDRLVDYALEKVDTTIDTAGDVVDYATQGAKVLLEEAAEVTWQFIYFKAVEASIPIIMGILIIILVFKYTSRFRVTDKTFEEQSKENVDRIEKYNKSVPTMYEHMPYEAPSLFLGVLFKDSYDCSIFFISRIVTTIVGVSLIFCNILDFIKIAVFPKLYLVEFLTQFIK